MTTNDELQALQEGDVIVVQFGRNEWIGSVVEVRFTAGLKGHTTPEWVVVVELDRAQFDLPSRSSRIWFGFDEVLAY